jgi:hypothetical protein
LDSGETWDILGIAGAVRALAGVGTTTFPPVSAPLHPEVDGVSSLEDLVDILLAHQQPGGGWYRRTVPPNPVPSALDLQTSAYAVLGLAAAWEQLEPWPLVAP